MRHLDTEALAAFTAVVDFGSFTAAAAQMHKTPSAISIAVSRLEERLGHRLFLRGHRNIALTAAGERLLLHARKMQALEAEALADLMGDRRESRVRLGMPDDYVSWFGAALVQRFSPAHPNVYIDLQCHFSRHLERMVGSQELDLALITQSTDRPQGEFLRHERQVWCTAPDAVPEAQRVLPLALFSEECPARPGVFALLRQAGRDWRLVHSSSHLAGIEIAVVSGKLLTVLPEPAVPRGWRRLGPEHGLPELPELPLGLLHARSPRLAVRRLAAFLRREFGATQMPAAAE
ncbi:LysR substrate-binding domain-containing protein [Roseomonas sp. OT10]|uniref:LysR substrate-binding domain-containing protein n=1 Tax=Roseomonas cutis TaxID=2897332 RepID=UPI001E4D6DAD|nr:LysR substrate-binding domain-containing protein [Roseomonas sp. OT10]UFN48929.1 LysR substrate-binding domain-containing protein [Roseomonas sp. OT10]